MIKKIVIIILFVIINLSSIYAIEKADPISDREIIEKLTRLEEGQRGINQRFDDLNNSVNKRFDDVKVDINNVKADINSLRDFISGGFWVIIAGMFSLISFVIWDRRSALAPAIRKNKEIEEREEELERWKNKADKAFKELAEKDIKVAEILKHVGLL